MLLGNRVTAGRRRARRQFAGEAKVVVVGEGRSFHLRLGWDRWSIVAVLSDCVEQGWRRSSGSAWRPSWADWVAAGVRPPARRLLEERRPPLRAEPTGIAAAVSRDSREIWNHPAEQWITRPSRGVQISPLAETSSPGRVVDYPAEWKCSEWGNLSYGITRPRGWLPGRVLGTRS